MGVKRSSASVCLSVCTFVWTHDNSQMNYPKVLRLCTENDLRISYKCYDFAVERSNVKVTKCKNILKVLECLHSIECQSFSLVSVFCCCTCTKPKVVVLPNGQIKSLNASSMRRDTRITLSPLLSCIESEQASADLQGMFKSSQIYTSVLCS